MPSANSGSAAGRWRLRQGLFNLVAFAASPLLVAYIGWRALGRRPLVGVGEKLTGHTRLPPGAQHRVLIHGVSLGEVALMRPLVPALEHALARACVLTTTTETGWQGLEKHFPQHAKAFFPFDVPWAVERFLSESKPAAVILLEAEFWPVWLGACFRRGIPVALVNARVSPRSFARFTRLRAFVSPLLAAYRVVATQNGTYAARLRSLGCRAAVPCGSLKADMVVLASAAQISAEGERAGVAPGTRIVLIASTSAGEEATILSAWEMRPEWLIVICPRHPERGPELVELCRARGLRAVRTSQGERLGAAQVLIVDEIGRLGAWYGWCAQSTGIALVGGSFGSGRGGQNMLEAAAARCATVVGWDTRSQPDSMHLLRACDGVIEATAESLAGELTALAEDPARRAQLGAAGHSAWQAGQGAAARVVRLLARDLKPLLLPP